MRDAGRRERHEVTGADLVLRAVDACHALALEDVDPLLLGPVSVIDERLLARCDARQVHAGAPQAGRLRELVPGNLRARIPWMRKRLRALRDVGCAQDIEIRTI